jgi:transcriptional regulator with XRE-family HTH domain
MNNDSFDTDLSLIGRRLRAIRHARKKSLEVIAGLSGVSLGHLSEIERGLRTPSNKHILALANALQISPTDLTKLPLPAPGNGHTDAAIQAVRLAIMGAVQESPDGVVFSTDDLRTRVQEVLTLSWKCDRPRHVGELLPPLIRDLHTSILVGCDVPELLDLAVMLHHHCTVWWLRVAGAPLDLRAQAVTLLTITAQERETAAALMLAAYGGTLVHVSSGATELAWTSITKTTVPLSDNKALQLAGTLALSKSWIASVTSRQEDAEESLAVADDLAASTGQGNAYGLGFGPTEVGIWRVLSLVELGDYEQAAAVADTVNLDAHPVRSHRSAGYVTYAHAFSGVRGRHEDALRCLKRAEEILPLEVQRGLQARNLLAQIITKIRYDAIGSELRGMAYRAGVAV